MMKTNALKSRVHAVLKRAGVGSTLLLAVAAPPPDCATHDEVVLVRDGVGDPCVPGDEQLASFTGYSLSEVNIETQFAGCKTSLCLTNHFQGRVSCPGGQTADQIASGSYACTANAGDGATQSVVVPVAAQCPDRTAADAVYCSCSCAGNNPTLSYCACPTGFVCEELLNPAVSLASSELGTSFCIKAGTQSNGSTTCEGYAK
jgi:hypothetical protein